MPRITRDELYLQMCEVMSQRGSCLRAKVACLITKENRILSGGYNGPPPGMDHCSDKNCDLNSSCKRAVHAEVNAIAHAAKLGISLNGSTLYCSFSPCPSCCLLILQAGIIRVVYKEKFRDGSGIPILEAGGVLVEQRDIPEFIIKAYNQYNDKNYS